MWAAAVLVLAVRGGLLLIWLGQRTMIYFADRNVPAPAVTSLSDVEAVQIPSADGVTLQGWFLRSRAQPRSRAVIVSTATPVTGPTGVHSARQLRSQGLSVLLFDFRGFGDSSGSPDEGGLYDDARAVRRYVAGRNDVWRQSSRLLRRIARNRGRGAWQSNIPRPR